MSSAALSLDEQLADDVSRFYADPLGFVMFAWPWGEPGYLEAEDGPDDLQREFLTSLGEEVKKRRFDGRTPCLPILMAETSGHGTGKSAMGAWIAWWLLSTRPHSIGTVTAGTYQQLESRTWAAIKKWGVDCITTNWFTTRADGIYSKESPADWKMVLQTCREENAQAFAGQHARTSTSWYMFDEASNVPDEVWNTAYGGLTDGEPMMFVWGQMVRNSGEFYRVCYGSLSARWNHRCVDSRQSRFTNKALIQQWEEDYGEDSDFFRVRVRGLAPLADELQYIDLGRIREAQKRGVMPPLPDEPLICGFDVSGGGSAWNVFRFRQGSDARTRPPIRITGEAGRERSILIGKAAELLADRRPDHIIHSMFVDSAFGSPIVERLHTLGYKNVHEINFGGASPDPHMANMRAYMWAKAKEGLLTLGLPVGDRDPLANQLMVPGFHLNKSNKLVLESKEEIVKRGEVSPDDADAHCLTYARPVAPASGKKPVSAVVDAYKGGGGPWS